MLPWRLRLQCVLISHPRQNQSKYLLLNSHGRSSKQRSYPYSRHWAIDHVGLVWPSNYTLNRTERLTDSSNSCKSLMNSKRYDLKSAPEINQLIELPHRVVIFLAYMVQSPTINWLGGITVRMSDLRSSSHGFDSRSGRYKATKVYSAFHLLSTGLGWGYGGARSLVSSGR